MATLTSQIQALIAYANETTGKGDTHLGDAVKSLAERYGGKVKGYTFHSFLQSDGNAYIDTNYHTTADCTFTLDFTSTNNSGNYCLFGSGNGSAYNNGDFSVWYNTEYVDVCYPLSQRISNVAKSNNHIYKANTDYKLILSSSNCILNGSVLCSFTVYPEYYCNRTLTLFAAQRNTVIGISNIKVKRFEVKIGGTKVIDCIPASRDSDGVCGMYDLVTDTFFDNANSTGKFTVGEIIDIEGSAPELPTINDSDALSSKLTALIAYANGITGKADATIGDAVRSLVEGYGGGDMYKKLSYIQNTIETNCAVEIPFGKIANDSIRIVYKGVQYQGSGLNPIFYRTGSNVVNFQLRRYPWFLIFSSTSVFVTTPMLDTTYGYVGQRIDHDITITKDSFVKRYPSEETIDINDYALKKSTMINLFPSAKCSCESISIYIDDVLTHKIAPVLRLSDSVLGFLNEVDDTFIEVNPNGSYIYE